MILGCNQNDEKKESGKTKTDKTSKIAEDVCECMSSLDENLSEKTKKIILKASKSDNPQTTAIDELNAIEDEEEKQKVTEEFQSFENPELQKCMDKVDKKYKEMKKPDEKMQNKLLKKMDKECPLGAALLRIGKAEAATEDPEVKDDDGEEEEQ
jgi:hypothetical protein